AEGDLRADGDFGGVGGHVVHPVVSGGQTAGSAGEFVDAAEVFAAVDAGADVEDDAEGAPRPVGGVVLADGVAELERTPHVGFGLADVHGAVDGDGLRVGGDVVLGDGVFGEDDGHGGI